MVGILWVCAFAVSAHLLYSQLGFNPTDDGFTLTNLRRTLDGQVTHHDFIIIRPFLSPLVHVPEVILGGNLTYWFSRFIFFLQCAGIAWLGTGLVAKGFRITLKTSERSVIALMSFVLCCHSFPPMAWHTIDGLLLCVLGLYIREKPTRYARALGYFLLSLAYLCKPSFAIVPPAALILSGDWKSWKLVAMAILPGVFYLIYVTLAGAFDDALQQLLSQANLLRYSVKAYLNFYVFMGTTCGLVSGSLLMSVSHERWPRAQRHRDIVTMMFHLAVFTGALLSLVTNKVGPFSFVLFGMVGGSQVYSILEANATGIQIITVGSLVVLLAWAASLSVGYNSPALASGPLFTFLTIANFPDVQLGHTRHRQTVLMLAVILMALSVNYARTRYIYRDRSASELTAAVSGTIPGATLILTNPNTAAFPAHLEMAIHMVDTRTSCYTIVPEIASRWVQSVDSKPPRIDWIQGVELSNPELFCRVVDAIEKQRSHTVSLVQNTNAGPLQSGFVPLDNTDGDLPVVAYVKT